jgi:hypothetical protein
MAGGNLTPDIAGYFLSILKTPASDQEVIIKKN